MPPAANHLAVVEEFKDAVVAVVEIAVN